MISRITEHIVEKSKEFAIFDKESNKVLALPNNYIAVGFPDTESIGLFEADTLRPIANIPSVIQSEKIALSPDGTRLICQHSDRLVRAWDIRQIEQPCCIAEFDISKREINDLAFLSNESFAICFSWTAFEKLQLNSEETRDQNIYLCHIDSEKYHRHSVDLLDEGKVISFPQRQLLAVTDSKYMWIWQFKDIDDIQLMNHFQIASENNQLCYLDGILALPDEQGFVFSYVTHAQFNKSTRSITFCDLSHPDKINMHILNVSPGGCPIATLSTGDLVLSENANMFGFLGTIHIWNIDEISHPYHISSFQLRKPLNSLAIIKKDRFILSGDTGIEIFDHGPGIQLSTEIKHHQDTKPILDLFFPAVLSEMILEYGKSKSCLSYTKSFRLFHPLQSNEEKEDEPIRQIKPVIIPYVLL